MKNYAVIFLFSLLMLVSFSLNISVEDVHAEEVQFSHNEYHYGQLNDEEKRIYGLCYDACSKFQKKLKVVTTCDESSLERIHTALRSDNPEFFWLNGMKYKITKIKSENKVVLKFKVKDDTKSTYSKISNYTDKIVNKATGSNYAKVQYFYKWICKNTKYKKGSKYNQDVRSVFLNHKSVCHGYASALLYLCNKVGINCVLVSGDIKESDISGRHAWNMVKLKGNWYNVDSTWGDKDYNKERGMSVEYGYLCFVNSDLNHKRILSNDRSYSAYKDNLVFSYPECTDTSLNYYRKHNLYIEDYSRKAIKNIFYDNIVDDEKDAVSVQFSSREVMKETKEDILKKYWNIFANKYYDDLEYEELTVYIPKDLNVLTFTFE